MSSVLKGATYLPNAVAVGERRPRGFSLNPLLQPDERREPVLPDAKTVARERLEAARLRSEKIVAEAEARAAEIARQATIRGYEEGFADGLRRAEDQSREQIERLAQIATSAVVDQDGLVRSAQREAAALALAIAEKIVHREVRLHPDLVLSIVEAGLEHIPPAERVRVMVNPEDEGLLSERWNDVVGANGRGLEWEIVGDPSVGRGGCMIEARSGFVDSRIETQMAKIVEAFEVDS